MIFELQRRQCKCSVNQNCENRPRPPQSLFLGMGRQIPRLSALFGLSDPKLAAPEIHVKLMEHLPRIHKIAVYWGPDFAEV
jgi:hypothetical protein